MTSDTRADHVCNAALEAGNDYLRQLIATAIRAAVDEEREACAKTAMDYISCECRGFCECYGRASIERIADNIRKRVAP